MVHSRLRLVPAFLAAAALLVSAPPAGARDAEPDGPTYGAPTVGACSAMRIKQTGLDSDPSKVVPCSQAHTAKVAGVVQMPAKLSYSAGYNAKFKVLAQRCKPFVDSLLGRTDAVRDSSAYSWVWFQPTTDQIEHGARWLSCTVILPKTTRQGSGRLLPLPTNKQPMLRSGRLHDNVARCRRQTTTGAWLTPCSTAHDWRATGSFVVAGSFPGRKALLKLGDRKCRSRVHGRPYSWYWQDKITWNLGHDHVVVCYAKTKH